MYISCTMNPTSRHIITIVDGDSRVEASDYVAVEDPLEIQIIHHSMNSGLPKSVSITMRTPGHDEDLAVGFLFTEGLIADEKDIESTIQKGPNHVWLTFHESASVQLNSLERNFYTTSSCGLCGKASIDAIKTKSKFPISAKAPLPDKKMLFGLQEKINNAQTLFSKTGGIHAAALFSKSGELIRLREDVGRHNALDKLIGSLLLEGQIPAYDRMLLLSGRASFELIQKAGMAGIGTVIAVGAPSSLAIELAEELNITLVGFLKPNRFNVYSW